MNQVWTIARKELRGYFHSAVAIIFLLAFLAAVLFTFFYQEHFFARGVADLRPLFVWLPRLLIFLVAALTMRLWSEEHKVGTIEILLTLPVPIHRLVLGKFLAGLILVAVALAMTAGLPLTVAILGDLDWGPVVGGYVAALLLAGAYLSIGLCVSASTDNQIVSLVLTAFFCGLLYVPGVEAISGAFGYQTGEILRALGSGSRFESVARGVIDLRDIAYWGALIAFFLVLNTVILHAKRWSAGKKSTARRHSALLSVMLLAANALALNIWLAPITRARLDMTSDRQFTLSDVSRELLGGIDQPLVIRGYFSAESHPKLTPLVPQIRDRLLEYQTINPERIRIEFVDPDSDEQIEKEAREKYHIEREQFGYEDPRQKKLTNAYFHVLVEYGDQFKVLSYADLIDIVPGEKGEIDVKLRNLEYDLTKTIKKVVFGFQSLEAMFAAMPEKAELVFYVTEQIPNAPAQLTQAWTQRVTQLRQAVGEATKKFVEQSKGKFTYTEHPVNTPEEAEKVERERGLPYTGAAYQTLVLTIGDRARVVPLPEPLDAKALNEAIEDTLRKAPGFLKVVGLVVPKGDGGMAHGMPGMPQEPQAPQTFNRLGQVLEQSYDVRKLTLADGKVDADVEVLIVAGPDKLGEPARKAIDQYLMRGGAVVVLGGDYRFDPKLGTLAVERVTTGLDDMLKHYGVEIVPKMVADPTSVPIPQPVEINGSKRFVLAPYPFFPLIDHDQMASEHLATAGVDPLVVPWGSPLKLSVPEASEDDKDDDADADKVRGWVLLRSSDKAWVEERTEVKPDLMRFPEGGYGPPEKMEAADHGPHIMAVALVGKFESFFTKDEKSGKPNRSSAGTRLVVIGSSDMVSDLGQSIYQQVQMREGAASAQLVQNVIDWAAEDVDLLSIRARGNSVHSLRVEEGKATRWEIFNWLLVIIGLAGVFGFGAVARRSLVPMSLVPPVGRKHEETAAKSGAKKADAADEDEDEDAADEDEDEDEDEESDDARASDEEKDA